MKTSDPNFSRKKFQILACLFLTWLVIWMAGCNLTSTEEAGKAGTPPEPGSAAVIVEDARSDGEYSNWMAQYISGGTWVDTWFVNQYERPFTAGAMEYQPFLDIREARLRPAGEWTVFEIQAVEPALNNRIYISLEIDTDLDNRPDLLVLTRAVEETSWNDLVVTTLLDQNRDAGGSLPRLAEPFKDTWNGFEGKLETGATPSVYTRLSPDSNSVYQIAVLNNMIGSDQYVWRVWLEGEIFHPGWVEYNDHYSLVEAGSPYLYSPNYPLKELASLDNTCLHFYGGEVVQPQPGLCGTTIEFSGDELLPPDDQFADPMNENPVSIVFPEIDPVDEDDGPSPTLLAFNPGNFFQPTPTPYPNLVQIPTMEFTVPEGPAGGVIEVVYTTPAYAETILETPVTGYAEPAPTLLIGIPATEMFDPYQGASPTPTPKPVIHFPANTPTPTDRPIIYLKTATPTP